MCYPKRSARNSQRSCLLKRKKRGKKEKLFKIGVGHPKHLFIRVFLFRVTSKRIRHVRVKSIIIIKARKKE